MDQSIFPQRPYYPEGGWYNFTLEKVGRHHLNQVTEWLKWTSTVMGQMQLTGPSFKMWQEQSIIFISLPTGHSLGLITNIYQKKLKLKDIL